MHASQHVCMKIDCLADSALLAREILQQTHGRLHAFITGAGTGGIIAGVSQALKGHDPRIQIVLADL
jgi:cysteine synthase